MSIRVMSWVFEHSEATLGARLVLLALADYAHDDGSKAFPAVETLAAHSRMSRRAVQGALRKLEQDGHIESTGRTRAGTVVYRICGVGGAQNLRGGGEVHDTGGEESAPVMSSTSPNPLTNRQDPSGKKTAASPEPLGFEEWLAHHCEVTTQRTPGLGTKGRRDLARKFGELMSEGRSLAEMKLASVGAHADEWRRRNGKDFPRNVLVADRIDELIESGRRVRPGRDSRSGHDPDRFRRTKPREEL